MSVPCHVTQSLGTPPVNILKVLSTCQEVFETPTVDMLKKDETLTVDMPKTVIRQHAKTGPSTCQKFSAVAIKGNHGVVQQ